MKLEVWLPVAVGAFGLAATLGWRERGRLRDAFDRPPLAVVERVDGDVRADGAALAAGATLGRAQRIDVAAGGRASIALPSGERVEARGPAAVEILQLGRDGCELWLHAGTLSIDGPRGRRASPAVYTREATAAALGARWEITAGEAITSLRVARGHVHVEGLHNAASDLAAGQSIELHRD